MPKQSVDVYKTLIRPVLFSFPAESIHNFTFGLLKFTFSIPGVGSMMRSLYTHNPKSLERKLFGLTFPNPVGLAAGFDKDARLIDELACFGFGFIEIGTLTPKGQAGNPKPRLFRLPADSGLINRMGFNNKGVDEAVLRLKRAQKKVIIGGNIGKNKLTPNDEAVSDYIHCFEALFDHVDYFVVNVSSPNTPGLRELQEKEPLRKLLATLQEHNQAKENPKPILLKIAPDLNEGQLDDILEIIPSTGINGIVASNTTISRQGLHTKEHQLEQIGNGGLSGKPVRERSTEIIRMIHKKTNGSLPIIAVGGIFTGEDAREKLEAGASLVQVYTGFIYEGPSMVKKINKILADVK